MGRVQHKRERDYSPAGDKCHKRQKREKHCTPSRSRSHTYSPSPRRDVVSSRRNGRSRSRDNNNVSFSSRGGFHSGSRRFYYDGRDNPEPCPCLGVFGMSLHTSERDLKQLFGRWGEVESVQIVYDRYSGRSRGFAFVYFTNTKEAARAKDNMTDVVIDGMKVRIDYSVTRGGGPYRHMPINSSKSPPTRSRSASRSRSRSR
uniref:RRM domain-containing protein n=1 Tax=Globodera rostochiensis TaxID=31243 RepID=A0A914I8M0_GLORO